MLTPAEFATIGAILMLGGSALFWVLVPRPGRPESWWLSTEAKALLVAVLIMGLILIGGVLLAKALLV